MAGLRGPWGVGVAGTEGGVGELIEEIVGGGEKGIGIEVAGKDEDGVLTDEEPLIEGAQGGGVGIADALLIAGRVVGERVFLEEMAAKGEASVVDDVVV